MTSLPLARVLVPGDTVSGSALVLSEPLSLWGGLDPISGRIIDRRHPACGETVTGRLLVMTAGRGSSSASSVLLESVRLKTAPRAILLLEVDSILALGAAVARELYGSCPAVVQLAAGSFESIATGDRLRLHRDGKLEWLVES